MSLIKSDFPKKIILFILFAFLFLFIDKTQIHNLIYEKKIMSIGLVQTILYFIIYLGLIFSSLIFLLVKNNFIRYSFLSLLLLSLVISFSTIIAHNSDFTINQASTVLNEIHWAGEAASLYYPQYIIAILLSIFIVYLLHILTKNWIKGRVSNLLSLVGLCFITLSIIITIRTAAFITPFPTYLNVPINIIYGIKTTPHFGKRNNPTLKPIAKRLAKHIFFVVDETIRGDLMGINNKKLKNTPFLDSISNSYYNYGIASSSATCSRASNMILQSGLRLDQLPDFNFLYASNPSIFQYAKQAGYKTYFIDGQNDSEQPQNNMTKFDFFAIDKYIEIRKIHQGIELYDIDHKIIEYLDEIPKQDSCTFTYINKLGCHSNYAGKYPPTREIFKPVYQLNDVNIDRVTTLNTYYNALNWTVDEFFKKLLPKIENDSVIILYFSDHGESIMEYGKYIGHCQNFTEEATIPFLVFNIGENPEINRALDSNYVYNKNHISQFQVFPTTLLLMGYSNKEVTKTYGLSIFNRLDKIERKFLAGVLYLPQYNQINVYHNPTSSKK
jgi:glucan phosphoethanolaminetransferase (alkaline phosphatase superfamily)